MYENNAKIMKYLTAVYLLIWTAIVIVSLLRRSVYVFVNISRLIKLFLYLLLFKKK